MINFDKLMSSVSIMVETLDDLTGLSRKILAISDGIDDLMSRMSSAIDSYNSSYVSLSTFDNDGTETTSQTRKGAAYSPMRAKLSLIMHSIMQRVNDAFSVEGVEYYPKIGISVICNVDDPNFWDQRLPVIVNHGNALYVERINLSNSPYNRTSFPIRGKLPVAMQNESNARVVSRITLYNAGVITAFNSDGTFTYSRQMCATSLRSPFSIRGSDNSISQGVLQTWLIFQPTNGSFWLIFSSNGSYYTTNEIHYSDVLVFSSQDIDNPESRADAIRSSTNELITAIIGTLQTGSAIPGRYTLRSWVVDIVPCSLNNRLRSPHLIVFNITNATLFVENQFEISDHLQCRDMFDYVRIGRLCEQIDNIIFNPVDQ